MEDGRKNGLDATINDFRPYSNCRTKKPFEHLKFLLICTFQAFEQIRLGHGLDSICSQPNYWDSSYPEACLREI